MKYEKVLATESHKWMVLFILTLLSLVPFWLSSAIKVDNFGGLLFSDSLSTFNEKIQHALNIQNHLLYDLVFILAYTALFYVSYRVFVLSAKAAVPKKMKYICFLPGLLDLLENILLCNLLSNPDGDLVFCLFWLIVRAKFTLILPFVILNLTIAIYYFIQRYDSFVGRNAQKAEDNELP